MGLGGAALRAISYTLIAARCLVCGMPGAGRLDLCAACCACLPWNRDACRQCGLPLYEAGSHCGACLHAPPPFQVTQAAFRYTFPIDRLVPRFKFHGDLAAGAVLATVMGWSLDPGEVPDALIPVPLHRSRLRGRGYDQALELARHLSRGCAVQLCSHRLVRRRATGAGDARSLRMP